MELIDFSGSVFDLTPDREEVFAWLGLSESLPCYQAYARAWDVAALETRSRCSPCAAMYLTGEESATVFLSVGSGPEDAAEQAFRNGSFIFGSLMNTIGDELLFRMDRQLAALVQEKLNASGLFISARLEPGLDYPAEEQPTSFLPFKDLLPGASVSSSGFLTPSKSMMYRLRLTKEACHVTSLHDCAHCSQRDCPYRDTGA